MKPHYRWSWRLNRRIKATKSQAEEFKSRLWIADFKRREQAAYKSCMSGLG